MVVLATSLTPLSLDWTHFAARSVEPLDKTQWQQIVEAARAGNSQAFGRIYQRHERRIFGLCYRLLRHPHEAEDATSEAFERAFRALDRYEPDREFEPWLVSIATRHCLNRLRRRNAERRLFLEEPQEFPDDPGQPSPLAELESDRERRVLQRVLDRLPDNYRLPLVLKYMAEQSYDEIAEQLGLTRNNVAVTLHRAKIALRREVEVERRTWTSLGGGTT